MLRVHTLFIALGLLAAAAPFAAPVTDPWARPSGEPLTAEAAFQLQPPEREKTGLRLQWDIAPGYYLYRERLHFEVLAPAGARLPPANLPVAETHDDAELGKVRIYRGQLVAHLATAGVTRLRVRWQGCADRGICYPPQQQDFDVKDAAP